MKLISLAVAATAVVAAPLAKRAVTDVDVLQYALTLEHLENAFYKKGISMMPEEEFVAAGFTKEYYNNLKYVVHDEESHVVALTAALKAAGASPVEACEYDFPFTDAKSYVGLASVLEGVGTAAYLGAAPFLASKDYLTVAGSILITEALHTAVQREGLGQVAAANPYGSHLGLNEVFTLAAAFIKSCPSSNVALPVKAFPGLKATQGIPTAPGIPFTFSSDVKPDGEFFVTFVSGLSIMSMPATIVGGLITTNIAPTAQGQSYALLTSQNVTAITDDVVLAGPAILEVTPPSPTFDLTILKA